MRKFRSIYFRNFITMAGTMLICFLLLGTVFSSLSYQMLMRDNRESMSVNAVGVERFVSAYGRNGDLSDIEMRITLSGMAKAADVGILVCDANGTVVSCSDEDLSCGHIGLNVPETQLSSVLSDDGFEDMSDLGGLYSETRYVVGRSITDIGGDGVCYIFVSKGMSAMADVWRMFSTVFVAVAAVVMLIGGVSTLIASKRQARPINEIAAAANRFAHGDFSARVAEPERDDEIGALADAFNAMADSLESAEVRRRDFLANVSHELKTPMTAITGFADGMIDGTIPPEKYDNYLRIISSESKRLARLVRSMLEMSHIQSADTSEILKKHFELSEVLVQALISLESKVNAKQLEVEMQIPEEPMVVCGDADGITQVVYNLIDNAIKFSEQGTELKLSIWKQGYKAYVSVENRGDTIKQEELPLIFDRFHKSDRSRGIDKDGVGLGLYIVKSILDNHKEDIFVTSKDGITSFVFTLTLSHEQKQ